MKSATVVVVGCGVVGASVAYHLARAGMHDVVVLDRGRQPGWGSTSRATGGFRAQFPTAANVRLSLLSREKLLAFREETGVDPCYAQAGYLWLATDDAELEYLRAALRVQHSEGLQEAVELSRDEAARHSAGVDMDTVVGASFCPTDGFIDPMQILLGYIGAAERLGCVFEWNMQVTAFSTSTNGAVTAVHTSRGDLSAGTVVNAAGPWAAEVAAMAGADLPVVPLRRQVARTVSTEALDRMTPMTIFLDDGFHFRVRDGRVMLLLPTPGNPANPFDTSVDPDWISRIRDITDARIPVLRDVAIDTAACYAGLYEMSPDGHGILGWSAHSENLFYVNGSSGHGVMHAPALGTLAAAAIVNGAAVPAELDPGRFRRAQTHGKLDVL